jgi:hypothetical protein
LGSLYFQRISFLCAFFSTTLSCTVGGLLFLAACFGSQSFKAPDCSQETWSIGAE